MFIVDGMVIRYTRVGSFQNYPSMIAGNGYEAKVCVINVYVMDTYFPCAIIAPALCLIVKKTTNAYSIEK